MVRILERINMNMKQLEKEIIKVIETEKTSLDKLDTHTTLEVLDYSFINLKKFVKKCFKEHVKKRREQ